MKIRLILGTLVVTVLALAATAVPAQAAGPRAISKCAPSGFYGHGQTVAVDSYLTTDLTCQKGFVIRDGATLDLRGHTLKGRPDPFSCVGEGCPDAPLEQQPGHAAILLADGRVKNGHLDHWDVGVRVWNDAPPSGRTRTVSRITVTRSDTGVASVYNEDTVQVSWSLFAGNRVGVNAILGGGYKIDHSAFVHNEAGGVLMEAGTELRVTDSVFTKNGGPGLIRYYGSGPSTVLRNVFAGNGGDGATIGDPGDAVRVGRNTALRNGGHGLAVTDSSGGLITDLGGNRAVGNRTKPQCVGVVCR